MDVVGATLILRSNQSTRRKWRFLRFNQLQIIQNDERVSNSVGRRRRIHVGIQLYGIHRACSHLSLEATTPNKTDAPVTKNDDVASQSWVYRAGCWFVITVSQVVRVVARKSYSPKQSKYSLAVAVPSSCKLSKTTREILNSVGRRRPSDTHTELNCVASGLFTFQSRRHNKTVARNPK